jgi:alkanesulfonate monooxygenase SsuD/methylene tetrahydromethanopterin reductase-like flavin-dependent oxidoreductase (luciferase family)
MLLIDPAKVRYADYEGHHVRNRGPLTIPRCPQRRPISPLMWEEFARILRRNCNAAVSYAPSIPTARCARICAVERY